MALRAAALVAGSILFFGSYVGALKVSNADELWSAYGTYSSLKYNDEGGDLLGYEFRFIPSGRGLKVVVQVSEGGIGEVFLVNARKSGKKIEFEVPIAHDFKAAFVGVLQDGRLEGDITYPTGSTQRVSIKRGKSYWDR